MKIKVIMADKIMDRNTMNLREQMLKSVVSSDVEISVDCIKSGPDELDCCTDEAFAAPEMIKESIRAQKEGYDAIVIYCFSDVAIDAIRENVEIPVIGPGEVSLSIAGMLCNRYVVITTESRNISRTYRRLMKNPIAREKMSSVRALDVEIGDVRADSGVTERRLFEVCEKAVKEENVDGIILGCLSFAEFAEKLEQQLPVKVFDPAFLSVAFAEMCVRTNTCHTHASYAKFSNSSHVDL